MARYIGDVHGNVDAYLALIEGVEKSIQCGDMGIGFAEFPVIPQEHRFIRGNHDEPMKCFEHPNYIKDGTYENGTFFLGGAWSIDYEFRQNYEMSTGRKIWWKEEECSVPRLQEIIDYYTVCKPEIVVTHDCPTIMAEQIRSHHSWDKSKTRQALGIMFESHEPTIWIHAHHHIHKEVRIGETSFICLAELDYIDL